MQEIPRAQAGSLLQRLWRGLGPGLVTGAADDDPSGIATHSQIGAQFGYALSWTFVLFSLDGRDPGGGCPNRLCDPAVALRTI